MSSCRSLCTVIDDDNHENQHWQWIEEIRDMEVIWVQEKSHNTVE